MSGQKLSIGEKLGYGCGDFASCIYWRLIEMFLLFYYTDVFGISAVDAGTMFLVTRIWDVINDPLAGIICDRTKSRWGKFRPYMIWGPIPLVVSGFFMFSTPDLEYNQKLVYAYITYTLVGMAYTFVNIPYGALMAVMTPNPEERMSLASNKFIMAFAGGLFVQAFTLPLVNYFGNNGEDQATGYKWALAIYGAVAVIMFFITFITTKERVETPKEQKTSLKVDMKDLLTNGPWLATFLVGVFILICICIRGGSIMYYFKYYIGDTALATSFMVAGSVASIVGTFCVKPISVYIGKRNTFMVAMGLCAVLMGANYLISPENITMIFALQVLINFCCGPVFALLWSMLSDTADYSEWKNGRRATGLVFSAASLSIKLGVAIGGALNAWILGWYGFEANKEQTDTAIEGIKMLMSVVPMVGAVFTVLALCFYALSETRMKEIEQELSERRSQNNENSSSDGLNPASL